MYPNSYRSALSTRSYPRESSSGSNRVTTLYSAAASIACGASSRSETAPGSCLTSILSGARIFDLRSASSLACQTVVSSVSSRRMSSASSEIFVRYLNSCRSSRRFSALSGSSPFRSAYLSNSELRSGFEMISNCESTSMPIPLSNFTCPSSGTFNNFCSKSACCEASSTIVSRPLPCDNTPS